VFLLLIYLIVLKTFSISLLGTFSLCKTFSCLTGEDLYQSPDMFFSFVQDSLDTFSSVTLFHVICVLFAGTFSAFNETDVIRWEAKVDYTLDVFVIDAQRFLKVRFNTFTLV